MTDKATDDLIALWKKQMEEGARAWTEAMGRAQAADPAAVWRPFLDQGIAAWATVMAQGPLRPEQMAQWKTFLDQWIDAWGSALERAMGTEAFAAALGKYLEQWLAAQAPVRQAAAESAEALLTALGLPSRMQVAAISRQLADLDDRLEDLEERLRARSAAPRRGSRPRTGRNRRARR